LRPGKPGDENAGKCWAAGRIVGTRMETIHIVGGGTRNFQLCQATADACGRRVVAGPIEATAIGNVMMQAIAAGAVGSIAEAREIVRLVLRWLSMSRRSTRGQWDGAYEKWLEVTGRK